MRLIPHSNRPGAWRRAFSLIELIFVMAITSIVFGTAIYMVTAPQIEKEIREVHGGIEDLVQRARAMAYSYQQPFVIEIASNEVRLMPLATPEQLMDEDLPGNQGQPDALRSLDSMSWPAVFPIPPKYEVAVQRWTDPYFIEVRDDEVQRWIHQPNIPCEPIGIQLTSLEEQAFLSREYHPLTAKAVDLEMAIGNQ